MNAMIPSRVTIVKTDLTCIFSFASSIWGKAITRLMYSNLGVVGKTDSLLCKSIDGDIVGPRPWMQ